MYWECKHLHRHTWEEWVADTATLKGSFSCTYYWKNPHLIKDFVSQYGKTRYYWTYSLEGQQERKKIETNRSSGLCGHSGPPEHIINSYLHTFHEHTDSKNFPHIFNSNTVCLGCKLYLK